MKRLSDVYPFADLRKRCEEIDGRAIVINFPIVEGRGEK